MKARCYLARYPLAADGDNLTEEILMEDTHLSDRINAEWDRLVAERVARIPAGQRASKEPMLQLWYVPPMELCGTCCGSECMATTNQPFHLS